MNRDLKILNKVFINQNTNVYVYIMCMCMCMCMPGEFHGQRSLVGYSPWGHKELDMTEWLSTAHINIYIIYKYEIINKYLNACWPS